MKMKKLKVTMQIKDYEILEKCEAENIDKNITQELEQSSLKKMEVFSYESSDSK